MQELLDLIGRRLTGIGFRAGALDDGFGHLPQLALWDPEVAKPLEAAQFGQFLDVETDGLSEAAYRIRHNLFVEPQCGRQRERVHRAVRQPVTPAERLCDRMAEREHGAAECGA